MQVGVILPSAQASGTAVPSYRDIRGWAQTAESAGFDSIWIYDHLLVRRPQLPQLGVWEAWTLMAALAEVTSRVQVGSWVLSAGFRNPALLAKMAITLDEVSDGRVILGLGAGNQRGEFEAFGFDFEHRVGRFDEAIRIIAPLVRTGQVDFRGDYYTATDCEIDPRGPRSAGPPILIGADGPRMLKLAARYADAWNAHYLGGPEHIEARRAALDVACEEVGRPRSEVATTVGEVISFGELGRPPRSITANIDTTPEALGDLLGAYEAAGVDHLMLQCFPPEYDRSLEHLAEGLGRYRGA